MFFVPIGVPLFKDGDQILLSSEWARALELLRDSFRGHYGDVVLFSPWLPVDDPAALVHPLLPITAVPGVRAELAYPGHVRARQFWVREFPRVRARLGSLLRSARVVHTGLDELFRPMTGLSFAMATKRGVPTVFVQDTDIVIQIVQLARGRAGKLRAHLYAAAFERLCRASVARADLTLLKSGTLAERYRRSTRNLLVFEDSSYLSNEIVPRPVLEARLESLAARRPLRFVYCGRLIERKGVDVSLRLLARARALGASVEFVIIGDGPQRQALEALRDDLGLASCVSFTGSLPYGPVLLERLAAFDALLFTPTAEDTPRMIFDGYASGLPLIATPIPYAQARAQGEGATVLLPESIELAAQHLVALDTQRHSLRILGLKAHQAAQYHAADAWYARRAERTIAAVDRRDRVRSRRAGA